MNVLRKLSALLLVGLLASEAHSATHGSSVWTCQATLPASFTIDTGSNRLFILIASDEENTAPTYAITSIGGQAPDDTDVYTATGPTNDLNTSFWVWDETSIAAMSGTAPAGGANPADGRWCWATIVDASQTVPTDWLAEVESLNRTAGAQDVTTTSSAGDYIIVSAVLVFTGGSVTTWDSLTERNDANYGGAHAALGTGDGGDATTTVVTNDDTGDWIFTSLVIANAAAAPDFDTDPALDVCSAAGCTFDFDANADVDTVFGMLIHPTTSTPTCAAIEAATGSHGDDSVAATGSAQTLTILATDSPVWWKYSAVFCPEEGTSNYGDVVRVDSLELDAPLDVASIYTDAFGSDGTLAGIYTQTGTESLTMDADTGIIRASASHATGQAEIKWAAASVEAGGSEPLAFGVTVDSIHQVSAGDSAVVTLGFQDFDESTFQGYLAYIYRDSTGAYGAGAGYYDNETAYADHYTEYPLDFTPGEELRVEYAFGFFNVYLDGALLDAHDITAEFPATAPSLPYQNLVITPRNSGTTPHLNTYVDDLTVYRSTQYQWAPISTVGSGSPCALFNADVDPDIAADDYLRVSTLTSIGAYALTVGTDCQFAYDDGVEGLKQTAFNTAVHDWSVADWHAEDIDFVANPAPPVCNPETDPIVLVHTEDAAAETQDFNGVCTDDDIAETLAWTFSSGTPSNGMSLGGSTGIYSGTPDTEDETANALTAQVCDDAELCDTFDIEEYVVNTVTVPTLDDGDLTDAQTDYATAFPWAAALGFELLTSQQCSASAADTVLSQNPAAASEVAYDAEISVVLSSGEACDATPPVCTAELLIVLDEDTDAGTTDLLNECVTDDVLDFSVTTGMLPNGLSLSTAGEITGTPDTEDEVGTVVEFTAEEQSSTLTDTISTTFYIINTVTLPDYVGGDIAAAEALHEAAFPWQDALGFLRLFSGRACDPGTPLGEIISQDPVASTEVSAFANIQLVISGACGSGRISPRRLSPRF